MTIEKYLEERKMSMSLWAENEVRIACERENPNRKEGEFDYGCACYESALKAFKCLMEDGHSGMSIGITRQILNRLLLNQPLTPIEDTEDIWNQISTYNVGCKTYQCKRMASLFKDVYDDGRVVYNDVDRVACYSLESPNVVFHSSLMNRIIEELFPITMPYCPSEKPYKVYSEEFLFDKKNGDFDTIAIRYIITPEGERIDSERFFKESENGWEEISIAEFAERRIGYERRDA